MKPDQLELEHQQRMADAVAWRLWFATQAAAQLAAAGTLAQRTTTPATWTQEVNHEQ